MKIQTVGTISEFLRESNAKQKEPFNAKVERHFKKYGLMYKIAGATVIILVAGGGFDYAFAAGSGIEAGAERLYVKLLSLGKWVIIFKGGFDTIKHMASGDFDAAKKGFLSYLIVYIFLFGLPWAMDEIDAIFKEMRANEVSTYR
ncbi:hypothetical protein [Neobacillus mesonae]|uniref:Uncharacterized protein n=1 Tax=Neobacillus mesonae TaxID=1193713 RepID=A0A3Q9QT87_9BACI|nr:hypothetical protein [Neobacillus mesonae]AZU61093.1 hypothetical protein CHR53_07400 [Neobacillus mesonae]